MPEWRQYITQQHLCAEQVSYAAGFTCLYYVESLQSQFLQFYPKLQTP